MSTAKTCAALATDRVDFVDKNNCSTHLCCLLKEVAHAACTDANKHLHEVRAGDRQETDSCFACNRTSKQCLARARRPNEQDALGNACTDFFKALWCAQEVNYFFDLLLDTFITSNIGKRGNGFVCVEIFGTATANRHNAAGLAHSATLHPDEKAHDQ